LIEKIREIMPGKLKNNVKIQFGGPTGSDAVESAIKLAKQYTNRHSLIAFEGSYHGQTAGALTVTSGSLIAFEGSYHGQTAGALTVTSGSFYKEKYLPMVPEVHFVPYAYCYRCSFSKASDTCNLECTAFYEHILDDPHSGVVKPAASIIEPIQGEGGSIVPPKNYIKNIENISREYEVPIIFDEIQSGFCRTGKMFSFEHSEAIPDIITLSKALGGGFPLSAIAYREEFDVWEKASHIGTFRGNVTAMAAGVASIDFMLENNLASHASSIGNKMLKKFEKFANSSNIIGEVRGEGLMLGIELVEDKETKKPSSKFASKMRTECFKNGVLIEIGGHYDNVARFLPPLIITTELAEKGVSIILEVLDKINLEA
jgi:diaminobutyrate-2-oxoglutarate transaminase